MLAPEAAIPYYLKQLDNYAVKTHRHLLSANRIDPTTSTKELALHSQSVDAATETAMRCISLIDRIRGAWPRESSQEAATTRPVEPVLATSDLAGLQKLALAVAQSSREAVRLIENFRPTERARAEHHIRVIWLTDFARFYGAVTGDAILSLPPDSLPTELSSNPKRTTGEITLD